MENKKTLKQKLWDKGKYFIPVYGACKSFNPKQARISLANMLCSVVLGATLIVYGIQGVGARSFNPKKVWGYTKEEFKTTWQIDEKSRQECAMDESTKGTSRKDIDVLPYALMAVLVTSFAYNKCKFYKRLSSQSKNLENEVEK